MTEESRKPRSGNDAPFLGVVRLIFILMVGLITHNSATLINPHILNKDLIYYDFLAMLIASILVVIECQIRYAFPQELLIGVVGMILGLITSTLIQMGSPNNMDPKTMDLTRMSLHLFLGYFGVAIALRYAHRFDFSATKILTRSHDRLYGCKILDTSVLIDGRILEITEAGFLDGLVIIPSFVLTELQHLSDSQDHIKRSRGRRGLDMSKRLQRVTRCVVEVLEEDFPNLPDVDKKLLALSKRYEGTLVTTDFNLHKVAEIEQVAVLNINQLAQSLKTAVLPGETLEIHLIREGKEPHQGIGYLEDGTMVVVENGRRYLDKQVDVTVSSVMQTSAGRLIFAKLKVDDVQVKTA